MSDEPTTAGAYAEGFRFSPEYETLILPKPSEWSCNAYGVNYRPTKGNHPNWFYRQMCFLLLGVRWVKDKGE
jgi:hypothetical protein